MISTSGGQLLPNDAVKAVGKHLVPLATVLTPNIPEAKLLAQLAEGAEPLGEIESVGDLEKLAARIQSLGSKWVLLKGGHLPLTKDYEVADAAIKGREPAIVLDVLYGEGKFTRIQSPYQDSKNTHGTGCTLACKSSLGSGPISILHDAKMTPC